MEHQTIVISYYFTGDMNLTGLKVDNNGTQSHQHLTEQHIIVGEQEHNFRRMVRTSSPRTIVENPDVRLSLPVTEVLKYKWVIKL